MSEGDRLSNMLRWQRRMFDELAQVPETLTSLRDTAANLKTVSDRLVLATEALERATRAAEETGLVDLLRRFDDASSTFRKALGGAVSGDPGAAVTQTRALLDDARSRIEQITQRLLAGPPPPADGPQWEPVPVDDHAEDEAEGQAWSEDGDVAAEDDAEAEDDLEDEQDG